MPITAPTYNVNRVKISQIRAQMKLVIETACAAYSNAPVRVHRDWKLKFDIGKIVSLLRPAGTESIHSWMIGTASLVAQTDANGNFPMVGSQKIDREVNFAVWGFFDYVLKDATSEKSSQEVAEEEAELIADFFKENRNLMGFDSQPQGLKTVKPFQIENIDDHSFSEGVDVVVAQCSLRVVLAR